MHDRTPESMPDEVRSAQFQAHSFDDDFPPDIDERVAVMKQQEALARWLRAILDENRLRQEYFDEALERHLNQ